MIMYSNRFNSLHRLHGEGMSYVKTILDSKDIEGRYFDCVECWVFYNQSENGHMYDEDSKLEEVMGMIIFSADCKGTRLNTKQEHKVEKYFSEKGVEIC